ncbi:MAG: hypothetical protein LBP98_09245 [Tannerella sp.]|jgi:hypothetical protein|nr:hypothetical protein [Tannerella sp.]
MKFNLATDMDVARFRTRVEYHIRRRTPNVELTEKRTVRQNSYLHLILGLFAAESGNRSDYVKEFYYKRLVNPEIFIVEKEDKYLGKIQALRSSADLTTAEMTLTIERFRNWASQEAGIYLPAPNEDEFLAYIQNELEKYGQWI